MPGIQRAARKLRPATAATKYRGRYAKGTPLSEMTRRNFFTAESFAQKSAAGRAAKRSLNVGQLIHQQFLETRFQHQFRHHLATSFCQGWSQLQSPTQGTLRVIIIAGCSSSGCSEEVIPETFGEREPLRVQQRLLILPSFEMVGRGGPMHPAWQSGIVVNRPIDQRLTSFHLADHRQESSSSRRLKGGTVGELNRPFRSSNALLDFPVREVINALSEMGEATLWICRKSLPDTEQCAFGGFRRRDGQY